MPLNECVCYWYDITLESSLPLDFEYDSEGAPALNRSKVLPLDAASGVKNSAVISLSVDVKRGGSQRSINISITGVNRYTHSLLVVIFTYSCLKMSGKSLPKASLTTSYPV